MQAQTLSDAERNTCQQYVGLFLTTYIGQSDEQLWLDINKMLVEINEKIAFLEQQTILYDGGYINLNTNLGLILELSIDKQIKAALKCFKKYECRDTLKAQFISLLIKFMKIEDEFKVKIQYQHCPLILYVIAKYAQSYQASHEHTFIILQEMRNQIPYMTHYLLPQQNQNK